MENQELAQSLVSIVSIFLDTHKVSIEDAISIVMSASVNFALGVLNEISDTPEEDLVENLRKWADQIEKKAKYEGGKILPLTGAGEAN